MTPRIWIAAAALCMTATTTKAEEAPPAEVIVQHPEVRGALNLLDRWIDAHQSYRNVPGISVGIVLDQDLIWSKGYGYADVSRERPVDEHTLYSICSISKLFTSIALMQQRDAGRLQLDDPVKELLEWFDIEQTHPESGPVTIRGLLTHSSGLPRDFSAYWSPDYLFPDRDAMIDGLPGQQTLYAAGTYFQYSNLGMSLVGEIAAAKAGMPYREVVQESILAPLGLDNTRTYLPQEEHGSTMAVGHSARDRKGDRIAEPPFDTAGITPAAGFVSNVADLARFASWQFRLLGRGGDEVLKASTLREMQRVHWVDPDWKTTWGLGFAVREVEGNTMVSHSGECPGYATTFTMMPRHKLGVIVLTNANDSRPGMVAANIHKTIGPALKRARDDRTASKSADFSELEGLYHDRPWSSEVAIVQMGDRLAVAVLPSDDVTKNLTKLEHEAGAVFRRYREHDDDLGERWTFRRDDKGKVVGVAFHGVRMDKMR